MRKSTICATVFMLVIGAALFANEDSYEFGFEEGYRHGTVDAEMGLEFDYTHHHQLKSGMSYDGSLSAKFKAGYADGYTDGFYSRSTERQVSADRSNLEESTGFVTVFRDPEFDGSSTVLEVGEYPELNGRWGDSIDSLKIHGPVRVILFDKDNFEGKRIIIEEDTERLADWSFGDETKSMIVELM